MHISCSVAVFSGIECKNILNGWEHKKANYGSFLALSIHIALFLNFQKIEPAVSYISCFV